MNKIIIISLTISNLVQAQIGINAKLIHKNTDLHLGSVNKAILLNHVYDLIEIDMPEDGMLIYDENEKCFKGFSNNEWTECFGSQLLESTTPIIVASGPGFNGIYQLNQRLTNATFTVTIFNKSFSTATINFNPNDLKINDENINVNAVNPQVLTLNAGDEKTVTYTLNGSPKNIGKLIGNWKKLTLTYDGTTTINKGCLPGSWNNSITPSVSMGFDPNIYYKGNYTVPYTGGASTYFPEEFYQDKGLTLKLTETQGEENGELQYVLSGTYSGNPGGTIEFTTLDGCIVSAGQLPNSCQKIKENNPQSPSGVYQIDPDGSGYKYNPFEAYCDMETDGGGWTLILNYNHKGGTNPNLNPRTTNLPLIGSTSFGTDESGSKYWGHAAPSLLKDIAFTELRYKAITNVHNRIMHFKTNYSPAINYIKTGSGSMSGIQNNFTKLDGHNSYLPEIAINFYSNQGNLSMTNFPFYYTITRSPYSHFSIKGVGQRWEVDELNSTNSANYNYYQAWIR